MQNFENEIVKNLENWTRYAKNLTRCADDSHDIVTDCVEKLLRDKEYFSTIPNLDGYVRRMIYNGYITEIRKRKVREKAESSSENADEVDEFAHSMEVARLQLAMTKLSNAERMIVIWVMRKGHGSIKVLADETGESHQFLREKHSTAIRKLKQILNNDNSHTTYPSTSGTD